MIRRPPRSTLDRSSAASDVYKRQLQTVNWAIRNIIGYVVFAAIVLFQSDIRRALAHLSLIHISEPTRPY